MQTINTETFDTMKKFAVFALAAITAFGAPAQKDVMKRIEEIGKNDNRSMEHLKTLTGRFGGRPIGSNAYDNARDWAASQLKEWGYDVKLEKAGELGVGFNRDHWEGRMYGDENEVLHFITPSYTVGTNGKAAGHVLAEPRTTQEFNNIKSRLKGAWVLVDGESGGWPLLHNDTIAAQRKAIIARNDSLAKVNGRKTPDQIPDNMKPDMTTPGLFYDEMVDAGVLGFIQSAPVPLRGLYDRDVVKGGLDFNNLPAVPDIKLDEDQFARIKKYVKQRKNIILEFDIRNHFRMGPVPYHNVVATLKGSKKPDEYIIMGAHLDAYDVATGATDDGTGTVGLLEAARILSKAGAKPDRTIIFILFAGEEFGLLGSEAWVNQHPDLLPKISNMFNRDGAPFPYVAFSAPKSMTKEFEPVAEAMRRAYPDFDFVIGEYTPRATPTKTGGHDGTTFQVKGIPQLNMNEWNDVHGHDFSYGEIWHTERDGLNRSIPEYQEQAATALALMLLQSANASKQFPRNEVYTDAPAK